MSSDPPATSTISRVPSKETINGWIEDTKNYWQIIHESDKWARAEGYRYYFAERSGIPSKTSPGFKLRCSHSGDHRGTAKDNGTPYKSGCAHAIWFTAPQWMRLPADGPFKLTDPFGLPELFPHNHPPCAAFRQRKLPTLEERKTRHVARCDHCYVHGQTFRGLHMPSDPSDGICWKKWPQAANVANNRREKADVPGPSDSTGLEQQDELDDSDHTPVKDDKESQDCTEDHSEPVEFAGDNLEQLEQALGLHDEDKQRSSRFVQSQEAVARLRRDSITMASEPLALVDCTRDDLAVSPPIYDQEMTVEQFQQALEKEKEKNQDLRDRLFILQNKWNAERDKIYGRQQVLATVPFKLNSVADGSARDADDRLGRIASERMEMVVAGMKRKSEAEKRKTEEEEYQRGVAEKRRKLDEEWRLLCELERSRFASHMLAFPIHRRSECEEDQESFV
ncbi:uncharacterized protein I303_105793 [Kwoniella dejecticola CBS 10117]|uniref:Uncharacterized protein n=1 Tax=Kwoniella dejecticola CBS 10117 TaxID=1296121 RepID=A0A1A6A0E4_9TREE|nr:uncharacterized protein I303_05815 [Kwoniella dejecticola CBS 10117]OBR83535.1 hypothetical protein I303_05815 [Kwoniella dejecticola CBS 10117]